MTSDNTMPGNYFIVELPLRDPTLGVERIMLKRFEVARFAYNEFVTELRRRDALMRETVEYRRLKGELRSSKIGRRSTNPVNITIQNTKDRFEAWKNLREQFQVHGAYCLNEYVKQVSFKLKKRTGANALPVTILHEQAARAWQAYEPFLLGKRTESRRPGLPRRRSYREPLTVISSRSSEKNIGPLKFISNGIFWSNGNLRKKGKVVVSLPARIDEKDDVVRYALAKNAEGELRHPICQVRIGYRTVRGKHRWFTQLVLEGAAYKKPREPRADGPVGVDMGSRHGALVAVSAGYAENHFLNPKVADALRKGKAEERRRTRAQDRSRRSMNPEAFDGKGRSIKGRRVWKVSKRYCLISAERREKQRVLKESKRQQRNALANRIVSLGTSVHMEKIGHRAWQRCGMGRSMLSSTPGALTVAIKRASTKYGREFVEINAWKAKLSQLCHACGRYTRKPLQGPIASRMSTCDCGRVPVQRDLYSAFLASVCDERGNVDRDRAGKLFPAFLASLGDVRGTPDACCADGHDRG
jgi:hypothetical protein